MKRSTEKWNRFPHLGVHHHLVAIADQVGPMGVSLGSGADGEITLQWTEVETVYVRRYRKGPYHWRLATTADIHVMHLDQRDPSLKELQTATQGKD